MQAQALILEIEGCTIEPVQTEMPLAEQPDAARSAAPAAGLHLVSVFDNCPDCGGSRSGTGNLKANMATCPSRSAQAH